MYAKLKYSGVKPIWYDPISCESYAQKEDNCIFFGSTSEYNLFRKLQSLTASQNIEIICHQQKTFGTFNWKIDFCLRACQSDGMTCALLARIANIINNSQFEKLTSLYIEYKGLQDDNFIDKMSTMMSYHPNLAKTVILVSGETGAFGCRHRDRNILTWLTKPIITTEDFALCFNKAI